jgi:hypothetical protein
MKKTLFVALFLLILCILCCCQRSDIGSLMDSIFPTDTYNAKQGIVSRDTSTPERALIGHWIAKGKKPYTTTHLYVTSDKIITITVHELPYNMISSDITKKTIKVYAGNESGGNEKLFSFTDDMNKVTETIRMFDTIQYHRYLFVDNKLAPYLK